MPDKLTISSGYPFEDVFGYARAVRVGDHVFVSGTTARGTDLEQGAHHQACCVLDMIADALAQAGGGLRRVVRTVVYMTDRADIDAVAHGAAFAAIRPASTLVLVAGLTPSSARVEIEATAIIQG